MNSRTHRLCSLELIVLLSACQSNAERPLGLRLVVDRAQAELALVYEAQETNPQVVLSTAGSHILRLHGERRRGSDLYLCQP